MERVKGCNDSRVGEGVTASHTSKAKASHPPEATEANTPQPKNNYHIVSHPEQLHPPHVDTFLRAPRRVWAARNVSKKHHHHKSGEIGRNWGNFEGIVRRGWEGRNKLGVQERNWGGGLWVFVNCLSDWIDCHDGGGGGKGVWAGGGKEVC